MKLILLSAFVFICGMVGASICQVRNFRAFADDDMDNFGNNLVPLASFAMLSLIGMVGGVLCVVFKVFGYLT